MSIADKKVTQTQLITYGVVSQPDVLQGTAAENKAVFDRLIREIVGSSLNPVIEELAGGTGAQTIGAQVAGMAGVGRFVVGLLDDIRIVDSPELTGYIREYIAANTPKM